MNPPAAMSSHEPVAIVGIGCRFPGGAVDPASFWRLLVEGRDAIAEIPDDRIDLDRFFAPKPATPGRMTTRFGGYLDHIDEFDAAFFGISPREAERMDPQQRLLLETAWEALEDAGQDLALVDKRRASVFVGQWTSDFEARLFADVKGVDFFSTSGSGRYASSGRLSYLLGFRGPSLTIDSACSSSLAAVHLAVRSIRSGESALALAGGVNVILQPHISVAYSQSRMMAPDGRCKFGDASGDGYVRSEGAGLVVLKALKHALADGDRIYALIRGSAVNNDGRGSGYMGRPSSPGQQELLRSAYDDAGLSPSLVGYVEAHGTGTRVGDPVELDALGAVVGEGRVPGARFFVGSVKTNIGHTEGAAGIAGLIKATLAVHHGTIPASLHLHEPNPAIPWSELSCTIPRAATPWPADQHPRYAGVTAFGIAGTNGHVVLEAAIAGVPDAIASRRPAQLLPLSARSPAALRTLAARYADLLASSDAESLHDVCWSAATRRTQLEHRAAFVAADRESMADALRRYAGGEASAAAEGEVHPGDRPRIAFVVPGQGAQWVGMARELLAHEPVFRDALERCEQAARRFVGWSILEQLAAEPESKSFKLDRIDVIQPVLVAIAIGYAALLRSLGIAPDAVVGHSMGEVGAAYLAGVLDLDQAMQVICRRSALMSRVSGQGAMAMVELPLDRLDEVLAGLEDRVSPAASNSPRSSVISGEPEAVRQVLASLAADGVFCRPVKVDVASHSPQMDPLAIELAGDLAAMQPAHERLPIFSTVLGRLAQGCEFVADYWAANLRRPVLFSHAVRGLADDGISIFIELGPHPVLLSALQQTATASTVLVCGRREQVEAASLLTAIAGLWAAGYPIEWQRVIPEGGRSVQLPPHPWQRERYWLDAAELRRGPAGDRPVPARADLDDEVRGWMYRLQWRVSALPELNANMGATASSWLVLTNDETLAAALDRRFAASGASVTVGSLDRLEDFVRSFRGSARQDCGIVVVAADDQAAAFLPIRVLQACIGAGGRGSPRLWLATCGGQAVVTEPAERVSVDQAALWGAARVVAEEHPELWGGIVDLDPAASADANAASLVRHILSDDDEGEAALRRGERYVVRLAADGRTRGDSAFTCREDAAYLITGGLGEIGLRVAKSLAEHGARRLILLNRTPLPPRHTWRGAAPGAIADRRIAGVLGLEALGVCVHTEAVDVGDAAVLPAFLTRYESEGWPPIRGVFHTAGTLSNSLAKSMSRATFDSALKAKLEGARRLDRLLPDLDHFVLFSSIVAFLPHPGVANYAAANAGLDALAQDRRARGLPAISVGWGPWENTGLAVGDASVHAIAEMSRQGIGAIAPERGASVFAWLCGRRVSTMTVIPADWAQFRRARRGRIGLPFRDLVTTQPETSSGRSPLLIQLGSAGYAERRVLLAPVVKEAVGRVLKIAPSQVDPRKALGGMGLGSLLAIELRNQLEAALGRTLSATLAWNHPTVEAIVSYLAADGPASAEIAPPAPQRPQDLLGSLEGIAALSDEAAALMLLEQPVAGNG